MDSSDSLKIDENLARLLAAYDQSIDGGDSGPSTLNVPLSSDPVPALPTEHTVSPLRGDAPNEGSLGEVLPDSRGPAHPRFLDYTPPPGMVGGAHRIGRFELRRQLGKGGCGIVFLAYDPKLQREVALKIPRPEMLLNADAKRRLIREALAAAEFDHPNLVPVFETGEIGPLCYIATAFCPGQTLAEWLDRQAFPVPVRQAARLVATVAEAVQHAHDRGVLHRDLKPNNVILQEMKLEENDEPPPGSIQLRGDYFLPRLVDFGLAKLAERGGPSETGTRQILGTPKYMAPEQAQARREDIGPPADVYGLGVILYELLAGRAPYDGASDVEVLRQAVEGKPTPPRALRPDLPRDLEAICLKAMARRTVERYRTAIDLADDLRRFLDGRPTIARPLAWPGRAVRWFRRNDQIVAIVVLMIIVVFVTAIASWGWYLSGQLRKSRDTALNEQATRNRTEQEREYSRLMRDAFLAWRSGNSYEANVALDGAKRTALSLMERPDFTHDYLRRLNKSSQLMIVCPAGAVTTLAVSRDGSRIASGHADGTLALWERATGKRLSSVKAHGAEVTHIVFARSGTMLFTAGKDKSAVPEALGWLLIKQDEITPAATPHRHISERVLCLAVSPDGDVVYAGGQTGVLAKIHLTDARQSLSIRAEPTAIVAVATSSAGGAVLTASSEGTIRRWMPNLTPQPLESKFAANGAVSALGVFADGLPALGFASGGLQLTRKGAGTELKTRERVHWVAIDTQGQVALNVAPGRISIGGSVALATGDVGSIRAGAFSPDGKTLFTGSDDGVIRAWDIDKDIRARGTRSVGRVRSIGVANDGTSFVVVHDQHVTRHEGTEVRQLQSPHKELAVVRVLDDGRVRGVALDGPIAVVQDLSAKVSPAQRFRLPDKHTATAAAISADGLRLAVGDDTGQITVWSLTDQSVLGSMDTGLRQAVEQLVLTDDGRYLSTHIPTGIGIWNVGTPEPVAKLETDDQAICCFVSRNSRIITGGRDGVIRVWDLSGREEATFFGHVGRVTGLGISPDGRTVVSGGATGEVKVWDLRTGVELLSLRRHSTSVRVIEFASDGNLLVTGGDGELAVWDARE